MSIYDSKYLQEDYYLTVAFHYYTEFRSFDLPGHQHLELELMGVICGECTVPLKNRQVTLRAGDMILLDAGVTHGLLIQNLCKMFCLELGASRNDTGGIPIRRVMESEQCLQNILKYRKPYYLVQDTEHVSSTVKTLVRSLENSGMVYRDILLWDILIRVAKLIERTAATTDRAISLYVNKALQYIEDSYNYEISLQNIADFLGLNPTYFGRIFKKCVGVTPVQYVNKCRVNKAKLLLRDTKLPIIDICNHVGLSSRQYFNHLFKSWEGVTPKEYRSRNKGQI